MRLATPVELTTSLDCLENEEVRRTMRFMYSGDVDRISTNYFQFDESELDLEMR